MGKFKSMLLFAIFLPALVIFSITNAFANCEMHYPDGTIGSCPDQTCDDFINPGDGTYCVNCFYNPNTDYISFNRKIGEAWIVAKGKKVRIMSDKYMSFSKALYLKYGKKKRDKTITEKVKNEYASFFKTDDKKVSNDRLQQSAKLLKLKVRFT